jgi:tyrosine-protein kinase Etk/Wzc
MSAMKPDTKGRTTRFTDVLQVVWTWRKLFVVNLTLVFLLAVAVSLFIPKKFRSVASCTIAPGGGKGGLGSLAGMLSGGNSILSMSAKMFGGGSTEEDIVLGILGSRSVLSRTIREFGLMQYYKVPKNNMDKAIRRFSRDISSEPNEFGFIEVSVIHKNPETAAAIANFMIALADSYNVELNIEAARRNRIFVEQRFMQNAAELKTAEDRLYDFEKKYGVFIVPEQVKLAIAAAGDIEAELLKNQVALNTIKDQVDPNSMLYQNVELKINALQQKLKSLDAGSDQSPGSVLVPFQKMPFLQIEYIRCLREVEIQNKLMEFLYPVFEQAKMEERKSTPLLIMIDKAVPPQLKFSPKRAALALGLTSVAFLILLLFVLRAHFLLHAELEKNTIEQFETRMVRSTLRLYGIRA